MARREMIVLALLFIAIAGVAAEKAAGKHEGHHNKRHAGAPKPSHDKGSHDKKHKHMEPIKLAKPTKPATKGPGAAATKGPGATATKPGVKTGKPLTREGPAKPGKKGH
ncbi:hypothetical protein ACLB2K_057820 [Fragaria x ananassa]